MIDPLTKRDILELSTHPGVTIMPEDNKVAKPEPKPIVNHETTVVAIEVHYFGAGMRFFIKHEVEEAKDNKLKMELAKL